MGIPPPRGDPVRLEVSPGMVVVVAAGGGYRAVGVLPLPLVAPRRLNCLLWFGSGWSCRCKHQVRRQKCINGRNSIHVYMIQLNHNTTKETKLAGVQYYFNVFFLNAIIYVNISGFLFS